MTTNAQGLTFGEWLFQAGVSPERWSLCSPEVQQSANDVWRQGSPPFSCPIALPKAERPQPKQLLFRSIK